MQMEHFFLAKQLIINFNSLQPLIKISLCFTSTPLYTFAGRLRDYNNIIGNQNVNITELLHYGDVIQSLNSTQIPPLSAVKPGGSAQVVLTSSALGTRPTSWWLILNYGKTKKFGKER